MQFYVLLSFLAIAFGVYGDQLYSETFLKNGNDISGLRERQTDTCIAGYFACSAAEGGGCCPIGTNCTTTICVGPPTTCQAAGQQICGNNCCDSPLICSESTLTCVNGPVSPAPPPVSPGPGGDPCLTTSCSWLSGLGACSTTDTTCICGVIIAAGSSEVSACVSCESAVNATFAQEISGAYQECVATSSTLAPAPPPAQTKTSTPVSPPKTSTSTITNIPPVGTSAVVPTKSGSGGIHEQIKARIWVGIITLSTIMVGLIVIL